MAKSTSRLLERLAAQQEQKQQAERLAIQQRQTAQSASKPPAPVQVSIKPITAPQAQGRGAISLFATTPAPAASGASAPGKLTLKPGTTPPPQVAEKIAQAKDVAAPPPVANASAKSSIHHKKKRKHAGPPLIERLAAMFPATFDFHAPVPLATGIEQQITTALGIHPKLASTVLSRWTSRVNYLAAMAAPGSRRFNLDGTDAGEVSDDHRAFAAELLAQKTAATLAPDSSAAFAAASRNASAGTGRRDMPRISATARKLKVTTVLDTAAFAGLRLPDGVPARSELTVSVNGRRFKADVATKSVRRVLAAVAEHGVDGVVVLSQGTLGPGDEITEAGLVAQAKVPAKVAAA